MNGSIGKDVRKLSFLFLVKKKEIFYIFYDFILIK